MARTPSDSPERVARARGEKALDDNRHTPADRGRARARRLLSLLLLLLPLPAHAELRALTCEPAWAALVREIGGERVHVDSATTPMQDPHYIQARPSLISKVRRADLLVCSGADLEVGWLPVLLRQAGNARVQPGQPGFLEVAKVVPMLEVPTQIDRALGDIHPYGNPHTETDPHNIARVAAVLRDRLVQLDPPGAQSYRSRAADFERRWSQAISTWEERAAPLRGMPIVTHHVGWVYLEHWLGLVDVAHLEPKPGIPPSASSLAELLGRLEQSPPQAIVRMAYEPERPSEWLAERIGAPALVLPHAPGATDSARDLFAVFDEILRKLLEARQ